MEIKQENAIEKMKNCAGRIQSGKRMTTPFTKSRDVVSSIAYPQNIINEDKKITRSRSNTDLLKKLYFFPGCDNSEFPATDNRKSCPKNFECMGADDTCFPRPKGKAR